MFFRFASALSLIVLIALLGNRLEKQNLDLKRAISQQQYRQDALLESIARLRLEAHKLGAPANLLGSMERGELSLQRSDKPQRQDNRQSPLTNWNAQPVTPDKK